MEITDKKDVEIKTGESLLYKTKKNIITATL